MRRRKRILLTCWFAFIAVLAAVAIFVLRPGPGPRIPPDDFSAEQIIIQYVGGELPPDLRPPPDEQNAWIIWRDSVGLHEPFYDTSMLDWRRLLAVEQAAMDADKPLHTGPDRARLDDHLRRNAPLVGLVETGMQRPRVYVSATDRSDEINVLRSLSEASRLMTLRAKMAGVDGDAPRMLREGIKQIRLGRMLISVENASHRTFITAGLEIRRAGIRVVRNALRHRVDSSVVADALRELDTPEPAVAMVRAIYTAEIRGVMDQLDETAAALRDDRAGETRHAMAVQMDSWLDTLGPRPEERGAREERHSWIARHVEPFDAVESAHAAGRRYRMVYDWIDDAWRPESDRRPPDWWRDQPNSAVLSLARLADGNPSELNRRLIQEDIYNAFGWSIGEPRLDLFRYVYLAQTERVALSIELAMAVYWQRQGRLPDSLNDLVTEGLLSEAPIDPFSGRPFGYDPQRAVFWSVGPDAKDDGAAVTASRGGGYSFGDLLSWPTDGVGLMTDERLAGSPELLKQLQSEPAGTTRLNLHFNEATDSTMTIVARFPRLEYLNLSSTNVSDTGLRHLAGLRELQNINLSNSNVCGPGLRHLQNIRSMQLIEVALDDEGIDHLIAMPNLEKLFIIEYTWSAEQLKRFREARPDVEVNLTPGRDFVVP